MVNQLITYRKAIRRRWKKIYQEYLDGATSAELCRKYSYEQGYMWKMLWQIKHKKYEID